MWNISLSSESISIVEKYIENYEAYFIDRFSDTGIWSESIMRENYIHEAENLRNNLYHHIKR
jgi:hypothetical protein